MERRHLYEAQHARAEEAADRRESRQAAERRELDEYAFRTTGALGIDLSRPERGTDEGDAARAGARI